MTEGLTGLGYDYIPSAGNFVAFDCGEPGNDLFQRMLQEGVIVRAIAEYGLPNHVRVSIGLPAENERFLGCWQRSACSCLERNESARIVNFQTLAIVGVGLIGGSIGKAAKERGIAAQIVGIEANAASAEWALANGLIDRVTNVVPEQADLIALCVPSDLVSDWVVKLADHPAPIFDVASVKGPIVEAIAARQSVPGQFLPCHPISGSRKKRTPGGGCHPVRRLHPGDNTA